VKTFRGPRYQILADGVPRSNRDNKTVALGACGLPDPRMTLSSRCSAHDSRRCSLDFERRSYEHAQRPSI
jgi:hypothetical protein